jgi:CRP-like cAMP-binding protein
MEYLDKNALLEDLSLFAALSAEERELICERSEIIEYRKGAIIYKEGAPADAFYILITGRVVIYTSDTNGRKTILEYLHRGNYFGIISLLTGGAHSVTAEAINDCHFLMITKADFDSVIKRIPALSVHLSQTLSRRLKDKDIHQKVVFESTVIAVISSSARAGTSSYALNLALGLAQETKKKVVVLEMALGSRAHSLPGKLSLVGEGSELCLSAFDSSGQLDSAVRKTEFGIDCLCLRNAARDGIWIKRLVRALSLLVNDYHYVVLDVPLEVDSPVLALLHQSDSVHILTSSQEVYLRRTSYLVRRLTGEFGFAPGKIKVVINEYGASRLKPDLQRQLLDHEIFATLPQEDAGVSERFVLDAPDSVYARVVRRIARDVGDCLVGLALGVGVAYGFCHIGVLKVIEEERIPIDVISGSSIGSVIASFWATGRSSQEILQIMTS